ncbi:hypothetical protein GUJ93_ZPchr0007g3674 [Zizania palustris]|uniref:Uncharacterized protein n=1 Tax=Zizania palustris TaxID=103762 RepID=A0A8J5TJE3_ZIZPA|nr:hypothetical protein GUJ93_ZPchr0007g3674 [Zizania palustris]
MPDPLAAWRIPRTEGHSDSARRTTASRAQAQAASVHGPQARGKGSARCGRARWLGIGETERAPESSRQRSGDLTRKGGGLGASGPREPPLPRSSAVTLFYRRVLVRSYYLIWQDYSESNAVDLDQNTRCLHAAVLQCLNSSEKIYLCNSFCIHQKSKQMQYTTFNLNSNCSFSSVPEF